MNIYLICQATYNRIADPISGPLNVICHPSKTVCVPLNLWSICTVCSLQFPL